MKRGCLSNLLFALLVFVLFGVSSYVSFNLFIRGRSVSTPNLVGKSVTDARALCADFGVELTIDTGRRNSDKVPAGNGSSHNKNPGTIKLLKPAAAFHVEL